MFQENYGVYGVRKVHAELDRQGRDVARCTVERLWIAGIERHEARSNLAMVKGHRAGARAEHRDHRHCWTGPSLRSWIARRIQLVVATP